MLINDIFPIQVFQTVDDSECIQIGMSANIAGHTRELCGGVYLAITMERNQGGCPIKVIWQDDGREAETARCVATNFAQSRICSVIGHLSASAALPAAEVYDDKGIIFIAPGTSHPDLTNRGYETVFRMCGRDDQQALQLVKWIHSNPDWQSIVLVEQDIRYGHMLANLVTNLWEGSRRKLDRILIPVEGTTDLAFYESLINLKPNLVLVAGIHEVAAQIVHFMRGLGYRGNFLLSDDGFTPDFITLAGDAAEGTYIMSLAHDFDRTDIRDLISRYRLLTGYDIGAYFLTSFISTKLLINAFATVGFEDGKKIAKYLRSREWTTPLGVLRFMENGDIEGIQWGPMQVKNGKFAPLNYC